MGEDMKKAAREFAEAMLGLERAEADERKAKEWCEAQRQRVAAAKKVLAGCVGANIQTRNVVVDDGLVRVQYSPNGSPLVTFEEIDGFDR